MDGHQYLHCDSYRGDHIRKFIIFCGTLLSKRIYSENSALNEYVEDL